VLEQAADTSNPVDGLVEPDDERARMGQISGGLWIVAALVGIGGTFLPGASHQDLGWVILLGAAVLIYGVGSFTGAIPWQHASLKALAVGMVVTVPVVGVAIYLSGASISYIEPLLVCSLLYAAFFFPARWAWPLTIELIVVAGAPLLYDDEALRHAFLPRYLALATGFLAVTGVMVRVKRRLVEAEVRQREIANRDPLTGVPNRRAFDATLRREIAARTKPSDGHREVESEPLALFVLDLDDFKSINDTHGHQIGDAVLRSTTERVAGVLRANDTLARIGGDEFAVIAPGAHGDGARQLAESIRAAVSAGEPGSQAPTPGASVGWAVFPEDGEDYETLMRSADQRLLDLKHRAGRPKRPDAGGTRRLKSVM
jgi:diguanylate cyclase (GGDEF)-like protein